MNFILFTNTGLSEWGGLEEHGYTSTSKTPGEKRSSRKYFTLR